jgi:hypothetical protein
VSQGHNGTHLLGTPSCSNDDKQRGKEREIMREMRGRLKKTIVPTIATTMFPHIWGEKGGLAHVASKGLSILGH